METFCATQTKEKTTSIKRPSKRYRQLDELFPYVFYLFDENGGVTRYKNETANVAKISVSTNKLSHFLPNTPYV